MANPQTLGNIMIDSFREGAWWWFGLSPDKISLRIHVDNLNKDVLHRYQRKGPVSISNAGGSYWDIHVHGEGLVPFLRMVAQVAVWLVLLASKGVFRPEVAQKLSIILAEDWDWGNPAHIFYYFQSLERLGFLFVSQEVAIDLPLARRPIVLKEKGLGKKYRSTLYSLDATKYTREIILPDGTTRLESKSSRKSLMTEYNRAKKIRAAFPLWRIELRLQRHHLERLSMMDLCLDFHQWLWVRFPFLVKILRRAVVPGTWGIRREALDYIPLGIRWLFQESGWFIA